MDEIIIRMYSSADHEALVNSGFPFSSDVLKSSLTERMKNTLHLSQKARLVAFHMREKKAVGTLTIRKYKDSIYVIQYVFTSPEFRKMGIALKLLSNALSWLSNKKAKKVFLDVEMNNTLAINLYRKLKFRDIMQSLYWYKIPISTLNCLHFDCTKVKKGFPHNSHPYKFYQHIVGDTYTSFFEISAANLVYPYVYHYTGSLSKTISSIDVLTLSLEDNILGYAVLFRPLLSKIALIELFVNNTENSYDNMDCLLSGIYRRLFVKGVKSVSLMVINRPNEFLNGKHEHLARILGKNALHQTCMGRYI